MKLAIAVILALVCHMAIADPVTKVCTSTKQYFDGTVCKDCTAPCLECVLKNGKESCINCGTGTGKFLKIEGDIGSCGNCVGNCSTCRGPAVSDCKTTTSADMVVSPSAIVKCTGLDGCLYCGAENKCAKCKVGYRLANDTCTPCQNAFCADCSDAIATCKKCSAGTHLKDNACAQCDAGCTSCPCTACVSGFYYFNNTCTHCADTLCTACSANASVCTACPSGYFLDGTCKKCDDGCTECTGLGKCTKCKSAFAVKEGKCAACPEHCWTCNANGECSECWSTYFASADKKTCTACPSGCDGCGAEGVCTKCLPGFFPKADKKGCDACTTGVIGCQECTDATHCKTCKDGFNTDGKGQCVSITTCARGKALDGNATCVDGTIDNCAYGNNLTASCYKCADGYYANGKACTPCPNGCEVCDANSNGYVACRTLAQTGFSIVTVSSGKIDSTGYLGKDFAYTVGKDGNAAECMPNAWLATYTKDSFKHQCFAYDKCPILKKVGQWECFVEGNAVKMTLSLFAVVVATLFTL